MYWSRLVSVQNREDFSCSLTVSMYWSRLMSVQNREVFSEVTIVLGKIGLSAVGRLSAWSLYFHATENISVSWQMQEWITCQCQWHSQKFDKKAKIFRSEATPAVRIT